MHPAPPIRLRPLQAVAQLESGASLIRAHMEAANAACYAAVRRKFRRLFSALMPTKSADLILDKVRKLAERLAPPGKLATNS